jgi:hypothetical protein
MKVGAITAKELSKNQTTNKNYQPTNIPQNNQNQMPKGCGTGLIVFGLVAIILAFFGDKINFFVIWNVNFYFIPIRINCYSAFLLVSIVYMI